MRYKREVWKIGGSILHEEQAYRRCASRIKQHLDDNPQLERLYIVVSAAFGVTDELVTGVAGSSKKAQQLNRVLHGQTTTSDILPEWDSPQTAMQLLQGELNSVHAMRIALLMQGLSAKTCTQCDFFPIVAEGTYLRAVFNSNESILRYRLFEQICADQRVVILSGFGGVNQRNEPVILGRNASDYVAALLTRLDPEVGLVSFIKESGAVFVDFETENQRPLERVDSTFLKHSQFAELLDQRVLSSITCDFRVCGLELQGTWVDHLRQEQLVAGQ